MGRERLNVDVDADLLAEAAQALGTRNAEETINAAIWEAVRTARRKALADRLASGSGLDFGDGMLAEVRRWRTDEPSPPASGSS